MVAYYHEVLFRTERASCNGRLTFITYGGTREETQSWGEKQAWDFIHEKRPAGRVLNSLLSVPVADQMLTIEGSRPLQLDGVENSPFSGLASQGPLYLRTARPGQILDKSPAAWTKPLQPGQALYIIVIGREKNREPDESVLCRAAGDRHACHLWTQHLWDKKKPVAPASIELCARFCAVGRPLFTWKRGKAR